ncbi:MAG: hypothetical protein JXB35_13120 [Anaerolineae bacterium]|nr:hypothetical protein [Anaerolineae bacterium]
MNSATHWHPNSIHRALIIFLLAALIAGSASSVWGAPGTVARIVPATGEVAIDETVDVVVEIVDVEGLYGVDISVAFDPTVIEVLDADPNLNGVQVGLGLFLDSGFALINAADNNDGTVHFVMTQLNPSEPKDGTGNLIVMRVRGKREATTPIQLVDVQLARRDGTSIEVTLESGELEVIGEPGEDPTPTPIPTQNAGTPMPTMTPTAISQATPTPTPKPPTLTPTPTPTPEESPPASSPTATLTPMPSPTKSTPSTATPTPTSPADPSPTLAPEAPPAAETPVSTEENALAAADQTSTPESQDVAERTETVAKPAPEASPETEPNIVLGKQQTGVTPGWLWVVMGLGGLSVLGAGIWLFVTTRRPSDAPGNTESEV